MTLYVQNKTTRLNPEGKKRQYLFTSGLIEGKGEGGGGSVRPIVSLQGINALERAKWPSNALHCIIG